MGKGWVEGYPTHFLEYTLAHTTKQAMATNILRFKVQNSSKGEKEGEERGRREGGRKEGRKERQDYYLE